jgi:hypothetical protein
MASCVTKYRTILQFTHKSNFIYARKKLRPALGRFVNLTDFKQQYVPIFWGDRTQIGQQMFIIIIKLQLG